MKRQGLLQNLPEAEIMEDQADFIVQTMNERMWLPEKGAFASGMQRGEQKIETLYADAIWAANFLEKDDLSQERWDAMFQALGSLATGWGFANHEPMMGYAERDTANRVPIKQIIWPIETAFSVMLAQKHDREDIIEKGTALLNYLSTQKHPFIEALPIENGVAKEFGCRKQLWTVVTLARLMRANERELVTL